MAQRGSVALQQRDQVLHVAAHETGLPHVLPRDWLRPSTTLRPSKPWLHRAKPSAGGALRLLLHLAKPINPASRRPHL